MRLIDADKLEDVLAKHQALYYGDSDYYEGISQGFNLAIYDVKETPTIDAEPIRHGHYIGESDGYADGYPVYDIWSCSECGCYFEDWDDKPTYKYCPNCGARMDEDEISNIAKESAGKIAKALEKVRAKGMQKQNIKEDGEP